MVAGCPKCSARYRVDADRIGPDGAKLRCTKCSAVFLVRASKPQPTAPMAAPVESTPAPDPMPQEPMPEVDSARLVLIADPDEARGKATADAVRGWGLSAILVHDGVEAMLTIQRMLPRMIVLDAALPKMFGFQVCEVVKRNDILRDSIVVLVGAIHHQDRYRRDPSDLYGADEYVESPDLPEGLLPLLRTSGMAINEPGASTTASEIAPEVLPPTPSMEQPDSTLSPIVEPIESTLSNAAPVAEPAQPPAPAPIAAPVPEPVPATPASAVDEDPERTAERERAQRLARIAVSEMVLYQPEKFDKASRGGVLEQALDLEIQEARALLRQRIGEEVRAETDFIIDELHRVAKDRGEQG